MNAKLAKWLRKEANYHPMMERKYIGKQYRKNTEKGVITVTTVQLHEADPRTLYKELKKEHK